MSLAWSVPTRAARLGLVALLLGLVSLAGAVPVGVAGQITLTTPYPAVAASPGSTVNFDISITTDTPDRVDLTVTGAPAEWTATLRGGGFTVDGVETDGTKTPTKVTLAVTVPAAATEGTQPDRRPGCEHEGVTCCWTRCRWTSGSLPTPPVT